MVTREELRRRGALELAYIGDGVFELMVRKRLFLKGASRANKLHLESVALVRASAQAKLVPVIEPLFSEEEREVFHWGRNAKPKSVPRGATPKEYALATAVETLFGWHYLLGETGRLCQFIDLLFTENVEA